jgi:hypothetical protein
VTIEDLDMLVYGLHVGHFEVSINVEDAGADGPGTYGAARANVYEILTPQSMTRSVAVTREEIDHLLAAGARWIGPSYLDPRRVRH